MRNIIEISKKIKNNVFVIFFRWYYDESRFFKVEWFRNIFVIFFVDTRFVVTSRLSGFVNILQMSDNFEVEWFCWTTFCRWVIFLFSLIRDLSFHGWVVFVNIQLSVKMLAIKRLQMIWNIFSTYTAGIKQASNITSTRWYTASKQASKQNTT